jgi:hypothetical protein
MDRALFGDEPLIVFIIIYCFLVVNFEFFLERYCTSVGPLCAVGATCFKCFIGCWQPSGKFVIGCPVCYRVATF